MKWKLLLVIFAVILLAAGTTAILYGIMTVKGIKNYNLYASVVDTFDVGFNITKSESDLNFGNVPLGGHGIRRINITNNNRNDVFTEFKLSGDLAPWILVPEQGIIKSGEMQQLEFYVEFPENATLGDYSGKLRIRLLKVKS